MRETADLIMWNPLHRMMTMLPLSIQTILCTKLCRGACVTVRKIRLRLCTMRI